MYTKPTIKRFFQKSVFMLRSERSRRLALLIYTHLTKLEAWIRNGVLDVNRIPVVTTSSEIEDYELAGFDHTESLRHTRNQSA